MSKYLFVRVAFLIVLVVAETILAAPVTLDRATQTGSRFFSSALPTSGRMTHARAITSTEIAVPITNDAAQVLAWAINHADGGYVILAGDDRLGPVIAYSLNGQFDPSKKRHEVLLDILRRDMAARVRALNEGSYPVSMEKRSRNAWADKSVLYKTTSDDITTLATFPSNPGGLLDFPTWDQGSPWDTNCPLVGGERMSVGCVATALAQIWYFWKYPATVSLTSSDRYTTSTRSIRIDQDAASFSFPNTAVRLSDCRSVSSYSWASTWARKDM